MKKVVLTGATGFLGFALLNELIRNDIYVYALCRKGSGRLSRLLERPRVAAIEVDLSCPEWIEGIADCDVFYHLAWEGARDNFDEQYGNVGMSVGCLRLASRLGCRRFICTGSQAEYGDTEGIITEETPLNPTTAYGACKVAACYLTADLAKRLGIEHTWARVFSVYGPHDNANALIPCLLDDLLTKGEAGLRTDGGHMWNYLYQEDAARALRLMGQCVGTNTVYNVASRNCMPLRAFIETVRETVKADSVVRYGMEKSGVNMNVRAEKLRGDIGEFECVGFREGIRDTAAARDPRASQKGLR